MTMNVPFRGSHVRPVHAEELPNGTIRVTVHNHDRAGTGDTAGVTVEAPGGRHSVPATFDQYLPPPNSGDPGRSRRTPHGGVALGSDIWTATIPRSSLPPSIQGVSLMQLRVGAYLVEGSSRVDSGTVIPVTPRAAPSTVALPAPEAKFGTSYDLHTPWQMHSSTDLGQLSVTILPQDTSAATYKNRSMQQFVKDLTLQPTPDAATRLAGVTELAVELLPVFERTDKHGHDHPQAGQPFVTYQHRADDAAVRVTLQRQPDGSFSAAAPAGQAFARLTSIGGYFTNADDSLTGFTARFEN